MLNSLRLIVASVPQGTGRCRKPWYHKRVRKTDTIHPFASFTGGFELGNASLGEALMGTRPVQAAHLILPFLKAAMLATLPSGGEALHRMR